jgi:membrane-associated phospholipid phosphatase
LHFTEIKKPASEPFRFTRSVRRFGMASLLPALCLPTAARGQLAPDTDSLTIQASYSYPDLQKRREITLSGFGVGLLVTGLLVPADHLDVPPQGFHPTEITWSRDRNVVGNRDRGADRASDWARDASLVFPLALAFTTGQEGERWNGFGRNSLVYAETILLSQGVTWLAKATVGRARPFAYLPASQRPDHLGYDVSADRTFEAMPSGHASSAWAGAVMGMTTHLLQRPQAGWVERAGVGFLGGVLAGATSTLRIEAGQHFPSDVLVGAGIGLLTGVTVPMLHRGEQPITTNSVLEMIGGGLAGTFLGVILARGY